MNSGQDRWQQLNAYVDGELNPQAKAEIAAAIAQDRGLAAAAATLSRLKAATNAAFADSPAIRIRAIRPRMMRRAAAVLATVVGVAAAVAAIWLGNAPSIPANLDTAISRHAAWVASDPSAATDPLVAPMLVGLTRLQRPIELPDLRDAGLQIVRISAIDEANGTAGLHVAYLGSRGCRISLVVTRADPQQTPLRLQHGETAVVRWIADDLAYTLMSSGMPQDRFALIAATAEEAVRRHVPIPEPTRQALQREREASQPCVG